MPLSRKKVEQEQTEHIAQQRIQILLTQADNVYPEDSALAKRYGELARKIAMKARIRLPKKWRRRFCRHCKTFLYPGINAHIRVKSGDPSRVVLFCELCQHSSSIAIF